MDTLISEEVISKKRRKTWFLLLIAAALIGGAVWLLRSYFKSSVNQSEITVSVVETGNIENTINATGEVLPEFEELITSPINASIKSAVLESGSDVKAGQSILTLDKSITQTEYEKLKFQLESKRNEVDKLKLDLGKSFYDIKSTNDIKQLRISSLADAVENAKSLFKAGGGTREGIEQAELNLQVAQLEKKQLENEIKNKQQTMQIEMREAQIAAQILENDLLQLQRKLKLANISASRNGVVTWINKNIGASVKEGESLVRIADLSSFKISGTISDNFINEVYNGIPAIIRINETQLRGHVNNISPSVQNSIISFEVQLDERHNKQLKPNMKVEVFLVTAAHTHILRTANGQAFRGTSSQDIFVVKNGKAQKRRVVTGLSNFDYIEIKSGVKAGDQVITSDMSDFKNSQELTINAE